MSCSNVRRSLLSTCTSSGLSESHPVFARPLTAPYLSPVVVKYMDSFSPTALPSFSTEGSLGGWQPSTVEPLPPYISLATNGTPVNIVTQQRNWNQCMTRSKNIVKAQLICFWPPHPAAAVPPGQPSSKESLPFSPWRPGDAYRWFGIMEDYSIYSDLTVEALNSRWILSAPYMLCLHYPLEDH